MCELLVRSMLRLVVLSMVTAFLALSGLVTAVDPVPVYGELGADLLLPVAEVCTHEGSYLFDILRGTQHIGAYDGELQGLRSYQDRLTYDSETCTITLRGLRTQDGTTFIVRLYSAINHKSTLQDISYQVIVRDPLTSRPSTRSTIQPETECTRTQASNDGVRSFVSFCLSLDSVMNAGLYLLLLILQGYFNKLDQGRMYVACLINSIITVVSEICSIGTMYSENGYIWFLILIPIVLVIDVLKSLCDVRSRRYKTIAWYLWIGLTLLIQLLFAVLVGLLDSGCDNFSIQGSRVGYLFLSLVLSVVLRSGIFTIFYCNTKKFTRLPQDDVTLNKVALVAIHDPRMVTAPDSDHSLPGSEVQRT